MAIVDLDRINLDRAEAVRHGRYTARPTRYADEATPAVVARLSAEAVIRRNEAEARRLHAETVRRQIEAARTAEIVSKYRLAFQNLELPKRDVRRIQREVAAAVGITIEDILGPRRQAHITRARQFAFWLAKRHTNLSFPAIGRMFAGKDHTTVLHGCRKIDRLIASGSLPESLMALVREGK